MKANSDVVEQHVILAILRCPNLGRPAATRKLQCVEVRDARADLLILAQKFYEGEYVITETPTKLLETKPASARLTPSS